MKINVEIGVAYGAPGGRWDTMIICQSVPEHLSEEEQGETLETLALAEAARQLGEDQDARAREWVAHLWVHHIDWDEVVEEEEESE